MIIDRAGDTDRHVDQFVDLGGHGAGMRSGAWLFCVGG